MFQMNIKEGEKRKAAVNGKPNGAVVSVINNANITKF